MALDGNFQQRHYAYASKDNPPEDRYPQAFIPPSKIAADAVTFTATDSAAQGIDPPCSDSHKAANDTRNETTWEKCDDNGLFASACRHDIPLSFINIHKTGEKLYYPISILNHVFDTFPDQKVGILYDLGCHLETHIRKRGLMNNQLGNLMFGTSVFHAYVHEWSCQVKYNPRLNRWWGLSDGECLERLWAFLSSLIPTLRVSTRLHRLNAIQSRADYYTSHLNESAAVWLSQKLKHAKEVSRLSAEALAKLHAIRNLETGQVVYTNQYFEEQWQDERNYHLNSNTSERHEVELGRLLSLEENLRRAWGSIPMTPEQVVNRAQTVARVEADLAAQRARVGNNGLADNLPRDKLRMLWYSKTELRRAFLSLVEEKQPLLRVCRAGESKSLGTRGQQKILDALRKRAAKLNTVLNTYNQHAQEFMASNPSRPAPPTIQYTNLLRLQADDTFWNDGLFTNANEPWAIDPNTQNGQHTRYVTFLTTLLEFSSNRNRLAVPPSLEKILQHPHLAGINALNHKLKASKAVIHKELIRICTLQLDWNRVIPDVVANTPAQNADIPILGLWRTQIERIQRAMDYGFLSGIPGNVTLLQINVLGGGEVIELPLPLDLPDDDDFDEDEDVDDEQYLADIENMLDVEMCADLEQENGVAPQR
ncbi:hypothetical protein PCASD_14323 [Puccinia coronata f. sp. avenae]|uniref:CxC1-like cysteine cluster associated with KDZ transposases domain-containing protein n=1 Tax=Puccinia coronata f. sp. avenae TaxID=200324 RepID=A0A2N5U3R3_9BASI|nr:hypothetical protein PCASD_14323 [Puccinia coronata f. sp. avenae]